MLLFRLPDRHETRPQYGFNVLEFAFPVSCHLPVQIGTPTTPGGTAGGARFIVLFDFYESKLSQCDPT